MNEPELRERLCDTLIECAQLHGDVSEALDVCRTFDEKLDSGESAFDACTEALKWLDTAAYKVLGEGDGFAFQEVCLAGRVVLEIATALDDTTAPQ